MPAPRVSVYRNLHKNCYSIRNQHGRVVEHATEFWLDDVVFAVGKAGRERVLRERRKNVHAFVRGERGERDAILADPTHGIAIKYDPYEGDSFFEVDTHRPVVGARHVYLGPFGILAYHVRYARYEHDTRPAKISAITDAQIIAMQHRARTLGDSAREKLCKRALLQERAARDACTIILMDESAAVEDPLADLPVLY